MGRHRSTLRELGWGVSNASPNPWKQGSAKRVVRTLDYSNAEVDEQTIAPAEVPAGGSAHELDDKLAQLQQDGRQQLDRIREQFEAQEAESKRKLERLNGRIAELGEGKRAGGMFAAAFGGGGGAQQQQQPKPKAAEATEQPQQASDGAAPAANEEALNRREAELNERAASLAKAEAEAASKMEAATAAQQAASLRETALDERAAALSKQEAHVKEQEAQIASARERLAEREAQLQRSTTALKEREQALASSQAAQAAAVAAEKDRAYEKPYSEKAAAAVADDEGPTMKLPMATGGVGGFFASSKPAAPEPAKEKPAPSPHKVRFDAASKPLPAKAPAALPSSKAAAGGKEAEPKDIQCDCTADWARSENLTASLVRQRTENPDEVFHPLPSQRTCELADIFSAPRRRERGKGSGEWTPMSTEGDSSKPGATNAGAAAGGANPRDGAAPQGLQLLGVDGEYMGEQLVLPGMPVLPGQPSKMILIGRSSSCDVTLSRDDQISRRHMQIEARDNKMFARDLGSTYGTRINGKALGSEAAELKAGDVLVLGASSFQVQAVGK